MRGVLEQARVAPQNYMKQSAPAWEQFRVCGRRELWCYPVRSMRGFRLSKRALHSSLRRERFEQLAYAGLVRQTFEDEDVLAL
jgi:hypothetical protein